jgi:hypothetical protein
MGDGIDAKTNSNNSDSSEKINIIKLRLKALQNLKTSLLKKSYLFPNGVSSQNHSTGASITGYLKSLFWKLQSSEGITEIEKLLTDLTTSIKKRNPKNFDWTQWQEVDENNEQAVQDTFFKIFGILKDKSSKESLMRPKIRHDWYCLWYANFNKHAIQVNNQRVYSRFTSLIAEQPILNP